MNLGAMNVYLGRQSLALSYHQQSLALYERFGDERRAAQLRSNIGSILIEYGGKPEEGLRDVENAKEIFRKLGDKDFEVFAAKMTATSFRYEGRLADAEHELNRAMEVSKERDLTRWVPSLKVDLARVRFEQGDYSAAKPLLQQAIGDGSGRDSGLALVTLARVHSRMGDFANAQANLGQARTFVQQSGMTWLLPALYMADGELAYESGRLREARTHFESASALWVDDLPETASVESRAWSGFLEALDGRVALGQSLVQASLKQAQKMGAYWAQGKCFLLLARIAILDGRAKEAIEILRSLAPDGERALGPETQAQIASLKARLEINKEAEAARARKMVEDMRLRLPQEQRESFSSRPDIKAVLEPAVPKRGK
jgi:tetratricopeptide (TPR) repeat protein